MKPVRWTDHAGFDDARPAKADLWRAERLFAGLNCLLAGQSQPPHEHDSADKFYFVLRGRGVFEVGGERLTAGAGELVPAPAGVRHGVRNDGPEELVILTVMAPPPGAR